MAALVSSQHEAVIKVSKGEDVLYYVNVSTENFKRSRKILEDDRTAREGVGEIK